MFARNKFTSNSFKRLTKTQKRINCKIIMFNDMFKGNLQIIVGIIMPIRAFFISVAKAFYLIGMKRKLTAAFRAPTRHEMTRQDGSVVSHLLQDHPGDRRRYIFFLISPKSHWHV